MSSSSPTNPLAANNDMAPAIGGCSSGTSTSPTATPENFLRDDRKKKSSIPKIFSAKQNIIENLDEDNLHIDGNGNEDGNEFDNYIESKSKVVMESSPFVKRGFPERHSCPVIERTNLSDFNQSTAPATIVKDLRVFVATWNVGGNTPNQWLNLEDFLQVEGCADIYVLGFQEIVPLSAGNVLVMEDNEPASKWLALIHCALNNPAYDDSSPNTKSNNIFNKPSLKALSKTLRADSELFKACNCADNNNWDSRRAVRKLSISNPWMDRGDPAIDEFLSIAEISSPHRARYQLIANKQMVGLFLTIWARKELVRDIGHVRVYCMGRGIMGYLGNKGCIAISMTVHETRFCFVCSHLASGEREGDELRRNADVTEIIKGTFFPKICHNPNRRIPDKILDHDRMIWLGDLNYRVGLTYEEARLLVEDNNWESLLQKDQLITEKEAGRVFNGWKEGKIIFAPTYKYSHNSDSYAGETTKSKKKRRTPAWCDRILWRGDGIEQLSYIRGESRLSDHRPVCAVFAVEVETRNKTAGLSGRLRKGYSCSVHGSATFEHCDRFPQRHSFGDF